VYKVTLLTVRWSRDLDMHSNYIGYCSWVSSQNMHLNV